MPASVALSLIVHRMSLSSVQMYSGIPSASQRAKWSGTTSKSAAVSRYMDSGRGCATTINGSKSKNESNLISILCGRCTYRDEPVRKCIFLSSNLVLCFDVRETISKVVPIVLQLFVREFPKSKCSRCLWMGCLHATLQMRRRT